MGLQEMPRECAKLVRQFRKLVVDTCQRHRENDLKIFDREGTDLSLVTHPGTLGGGPSCIGCRRFQRTAKHKSGQQTKADQAILDPADLRMILTEDAPCQTDYQQGKRWSPGRVVSVLGAMVLVTMCSVSLLTLSLETTSTTTTTATKTATTTTTTMTTTTASATTTTKTMKTTVTTKTTTSSYNVNNIYVNSGRFWVPVSPAKANQKPSLFCWLVLRLGEQHLVKYQLTTGVGIFDCNEWAVMTEVTVALNRWVNHGFPAMPAWTTNSADLASWAIGNTQAPKGPEGNPLNAFAFMAAWAAIRDSKRLPWHDWVVKVDPDTVWFPPRLRHQLQIKMPSHGDGGDSIFIRNCQRWNTMQGPMEVLSRTAALTMLDQQWKCGSFNHRAEDQFVVDCLKHLGVGGWLEQTFLNDQYCDGYTNCNDRWKVGFHPFKSVGAFDLCVKQTVR